MPWRNYQNVEVSPPQQVPIRRRYSVTADILSYQRCPRQYGYFKVHSYEPAHSVQVYFGTIIHQVLDRAHAHYKGLYDPATAGQIPTDGDIEEYFTEVDSALRSRGIRAINKDLRNLACELIKRFNQLEGPTLYPRVRETEHPIQADQGSYILHGTVDVLADPEIGEPTYDQMEIWDYKGTKFPDPSVSNPRQAELNHRRLQMYEFQMYVYAELYRARNGVYPAKAVLYFLNELNDGPRPIRRPSNALYEVVFDQEVIQQALDNFEAIVDVIEQSRDLDQWPAPPPTQDPGKETCDICDIRWSCPLKRGKYPMRYP
jgi:hypothetical protein